MSSIKSLKYRHHKLADAKEQIAILSNGIFSKDHLPSFDQKLKESGNFPLRPVETEIFQMNLGYMCNQTCKHCHVDAGPDRKEIMTRETMVSCLNVIKANPNIKVIDLTGGAPEMNPEFRWLIQELRKDFNGEIIVRCNLTIILANSKYNDLPQFYKTHKLKVVSSLPFYKADKTDRQRGDGVFNTSIKALKLLNEIGYGEDNSGLFLDLVYNPSGAFLPSDQSILEHEFKMELKEHFNIKFNKLLTITNLPISRFLDYLIATDNYEDYMTKLVMAYNPAAVQGVMCKNTISIDYNGYLYDCDFNQMLNLSVNVEQSLHINNYNAKELLNRNIVSNQHCFGCTAGSGSSCSGTTI